MRGSDHHAGNRALESYGITQFRGRTYIVEDEDIDAVGRHHVGCNPGEFLAVVAAVVGYAETQVILLAVGQDIVCKALGGHTYRVFVHAVGAYTHNAAQAAGAEFKILVESIFKCSGVAVAEFDYLAFGFGIEVAGEPGIGPGNIVCHNSWF